MKSKPHLFLHSYLPEPTVRKIISFFGSVRIYQPWFMNPPDFFKNLKLEVFNPPIELKPREDFMETLSGYRLWAEQNYERSYKEIVKFSETACRDDSAIWEIRRLLRGVAQPAPGTKAEELTMKWHVLLHLAADIEKQYFELMNMMNDLKEKRPILEGALHDPGEAEGIFDDMGDITTVDMPYNFNIGSAMDAWFSLFSGYINKKDLLITCNRRLFDYISSKWDDFTEKEKTSSSHFFSFTLPDISSEGKKEKDIVKIRRLLLGFGEDPNRCLNELALLTREAEKAFPQDSLQGSIKFYIRYFPSISCGRSIEADDLLRHIVGNTVILMSESSPN